MFDLASPTWAARCPAAAILPWRWRGGCRAQIVRIAEVRGTFAEFYASQRRSCEGASKNADNPSDVGALPPDQRPPYGLARCSGGARLGGGRGRAERSRVPLRAVFAAIAGGTDLFFAPVIEYVAAHRVEGNLWRGRGRRWWGRVCRAQSRYRSARGVGLGNGDGGRVGRPEHASLRAVPFSLTVRAARLRPPAPAAGLDPSGPAASGAATVPRIWSAPRWQKVSRVSLRSLRDRKPRNYRGKYAQLVAEL